MFTPQIEANHNKDYSVVKTFTTGHSKECLVFSCKCFTNTIEKQKKSVS
jgi:hypothetical protein